MGWFDIGVSLPKAFMLGGAPVARKKGRSRLSGS